MDKLYFGDILIGDILRTGDDFPWFHGGFQLRLDISDPASTHIAQYISHSIRVSDFYMDETGSDPASDIQDQLLKEELEFDDLIHSDQWSIIHSDGKVTRILIPVFHSDGSIGWRLA